MAITLCACSKAPQFTPVIVADPPEPAVATSADAYVLSEAELAKQIEAANAGVASAASVVADHYEEGLQDQPAQADAWRRKAAGLGDPKSLYIMAWTSLDDGRCQEGSAFATRLLDTDDEERKSALRGYLAAESREEQVPCKAEIRRLHATK